MAESEWKESVAMDASDSSGSAPVRGIRRADIVVLALSALVLALAAAMFVNAHTARAPGPAGSFGVAGLSGTSGKTIDGIPCESNEQLVYHVHAHVDILDRGRPITIPANVGINYDKGCIYWVHTHTPDGIIHIEAPYHKHPTLGNFFDIWGMPLTSSRVVTARVKPGQSIRVWVNLKRYQGDPRAIKLGAHTTIAIEIGPPFPRPRPFDFGQL